MKNLIIFIFAASVLLSLAGCKSGRKEDNAEFNKEVLEADAEAVANSMLSGDFESVTAKFDETMATALNAKSLKAGWDSAVAGLGEYIEQVKVEGAEKGRYYVVVVTERFENNGLAVRVSYNEEGLISGLQCVYADVTVPSEPLDSDTYTEAEITVAADPEMPLGGTLTLPKDTEKPPVVILVHGSGASDRDENIFGNKPFADIAHGLAQQGIATLRYDKRHYIYPENAGELGASITLRDETLNDVYAALELLKNDDRVDGDKVFVLGHSLGGMLTPVIAAEHPELSGVISMAGTLRQLWEVVYDQNQEALANMDTSAFSDPEKAALEGQVKQIDADMKTLSGDFSDLEDDTLLMGIPAGYWRSCKEFNGKKYIQEISMPMLILQGSEDFQIYPEKDYTLWQESLKGRDNVSFRLYEGINHLMMPTHGKRDISDYQIIESVDKQVIDDIAAFVKVVK